MTLLSADRVFRLLVALVVALYRHVDRPCLRVVQRRFHASPIRYTTCVLRHYERPIVVVRRRL